jgi:hypothetical protein
MKLTKPQDALLKRIKRCPNGYFIERHELRTAGKLKALGLIDMNASLTVAYPKEGK